MGLEKAIKHKKEYRKPYQDSRRFDYTCRNHGSCNYCLDNRMHSSKRRKLDIQQQIKEYIKED